MKAKLHSRFYSCYLTFPKLGMAPMLFMEWVSYKCFVEKMPVKIERMLDRRDEDLFLVELNTTLEVYKECLDYINVNL